MRVVVLLKQVPDIVADRHLDPSGLLERTPADAVLNEIDEGALEIALRAAQELGGEVIAITMGPASAAATVRKALQVGASTGIHLHDDLLAGSDAVGTARALGAAVRLLESEDPASPVALVVAGMTALDGLGAVVPALVAATLRRPVISGATSVTVSADQVVATRDTAEGTETLRATLPAVISVSDTVAALRAPNFTTMLAARSAQVRVLTAADLDLAPNQVGLTGARAVVGEVHQHPARPPVQVLPDAAALVDALAERGLLEVGA